LESLPLHDFLDEGVVDRIVSLFKVDEHGFGVDLSSKITIETIREVPDVFTPIPTRNETLLTVMEGSLTRRHDGICNGFGHHTVFRVVHHYGTVVEDFARIILGDQEETPPVEGVRWGDSV
jgi:hypothetical protein